MIICLGPVCVPLHLLLPFLVGLLHQYGYLKWFRKEWVTIRYWANKFKGKKPSTADSETSAPNTPPTKDRGGPGERDAAALRPGGGATPETTNPDCKKSD
ncbi:hypothetical protein PLESTB_001005400 [Pleodorina starrii]|uniref:Uncharacterized protein n=1 Tax=Pleodorina starrii TaxID=330485 RepID=A0A9W6BNP0_9CHLO|nr:hypothetical protein PLESTB_001005400 [Pleodorina starrii]